MIFMASLGTAQVLPGLQALQAPSRTPSQDAASIGMAQCGQLLDKMSTQTVNGQAEQTSGWLAKDPSKHIFQSVIGISQPGTPPDALATLAVAPMVGNTCEGVATGVYPLPVDCNTADLAVRNSGGKMLSTLKNVRVMLDGNGERLMLLPGAKDTCIAISAKSFIPGA